MSCPSFPGCAAPVTGLTSIVGTAPEEDAYLVLEMAKPWPAKIKKMEGLVDGIRGVLKKHKKEDFKLLATPDIPWLKPTPEPRALLLRWSGSQALCEMVAQAGPETVKEAISRPPSGQPEPLYLVCTHGSRDPCCGVKGVPIYRTLLEQSQRKTLQVSHLGGHRFAPVILVMPEWKFYGHLTPDNILGLDQALQAGSPFLEGYRGSGRLSKAIQVVEASLWKTHGSKLLSVQRVGGDKARPVVEARFSNGEIQHYEALVDYYRYEGYKSCKDFRKSKKSELKLPRLKSLTATTVVPLSSRE